MKTPLSILTALALPIAFASPQQQLASAELAATCCKDSAVVVVIDTAKVKGALSAWNLLPAITMQNFRPADKRGVNVFEAPKDEGIPFTGFRYSLGASFRQ